MSLDPEIIKGLAQAHIDQAIGATKRSVSLKHRALGRPSPLLEQDETKQEEHENGGTAGNDSTDGAGI